MTQEYRDAGVPFLRSQDVKPHRIEPVDLRFISPEFHRQISKSALRPGDVVVVRTGAPGTAAVIPDWLPDANCADLVVIRPGKRIHSRFLAYYFNSRSGQQHVHAHTVGAVQQHFNVGAAREARLRLPELHEQQAIGNALGALDDKIDLNRRMNETLEAMARALFRAWFRDVEALRESADDLVRDGVLEVGDGYRAKNSELGPPGLPFIRAGDLNSGFDTAGADVLSMASVPNARTKVSRPGDVAFTSKGTVGRFARVTSHTARFVYSPQVCFWRSLDPARLDPTILYCWMQDDDFQRQILAVAGQTDMAPYVSLRDQRKMKVPVFPESHLVLADRIKPLLDHGALLIEEAKTLGAIRDALLPKLLSGELRVREVEAAVG